MFWFNRSSQSLQPASKTINTMKVSIYQENTCQKYQHHIKVIIIVNELTRLTYDAIYLCFCYISGSSYKMWWDLVTSVHFEENINNIQQKMFSCDCDVVLPVMPLLLMILVPTAVGVCACFGCVSRVHSLCKPLHWHHLCGCNRKSSNTFLYVIFKNFFFFFWFGKFPMFKFT